MALTLSLMFQIKSIELIKTLLTVINTKKPYSQGELQA